MRSASRPGSPVGWCQRIQGPLGRAGDLARLFGLAAFLPLDLAVVLIVESPWFPEAGSHWFGEVTARHEVAPAVDAVRWLGHRPARRPEDHLTVVGEVERGLVAGAQQVVGLSWTTSSASSRIHSPTVGIVLCASRNDAVVRYALANSTAPMPWQTTQLRPPRPHSSACPPRQRAGFEAILAEPFVGRPDSTNAGRGSAR